MLTSLHITDKHQFDQLLDSIHDEQFDLNEVQYHPEKQILEIPIRRVFHGRPKKQIRNWFFYKVYEVDIVRSKLVIQNVEEYKAHDRERIGIYSFNTIKYDKDNELLIISADPNLEMKLKIAELKMDFQDIEVNGKATLSYTFGLIESGPKRVFE